LVRPGRQHAQIAGFVAEVRTGDILAPESLKGLADGADVVFHLAARVTDHGSRSQFHAAIVGGTRNVLRASAGRAGRFVQVSSTTACGVGRHLRARKEDDPCFRSGVPYSDAKLEAEELVGSHGGRFPDGFTIVRPSNVIGPGSPYVDEVCRRFLSPLGVPLIDRGRHSASLIYVANLVDGIIRAGTCQAAAGRIYHFCDDWQVSWKRYLTDLSSFLGKSPKGHIPFHLAWAMGHVFERLCAPLGLRPPVTRLAAAIMAGTTTWTPPGHKPNWGGRHESLTRRPCGKSAGMSIMLAPLDRFLLTRRSTMWHFLMRLKFMNKIFSF
jgi:nucleoside-diphosphate-sugar epimerase